jgi:NRAMP (natural resistance-associated macrophage protein)-like metal ion transporter
LRKRTARLGAGLGPGIITGASDDDPSGILTYLQSGAVLGVRTLWTALLTLPLMYAVQEMCARIGFVTERGLMHLIKRRYARSVVVAIAAVSVIVIVTNIGADLLAVGTVLERLSSVSRFLWLPLVAAAILLGTIFFSYRRFARVLLVLSLSLFCYVIAAFYLNVDWAAALRATFIPSLPWSKKGILLVTAILGTTISPYLFFWQASEEVEEERERIREHPTRRFTVTRRELKGLDRGTLIGMVFSNIVTWFIIAGASRLGTGYGVHEIANFDQASLVLRPILGPFAYLMFAIGIIGTALLAIPVLAGAVGYILSEIFDWREGMNKRFRQAHGFYLAIIGATVIGMLLCFLGLDPVTLLIYTAVLYTLITPPLVFLIMRIGNDERLMKQYKNSRLSNVFGWLTFGVTGAAAVAYLVSVIFF